MVTNFVSGSAATGSDGSGLHAQLSGGGDASVVLLHGLFGAGGNLGVIARALAAAGYRVHQVDLPDHGRSPWVDDMSLPAQAALVRDYIAVNVGGAAVLLGHSLGGKVAMQLALETPERVSALLVADIAPVAYRGSHGAVFAAIAAVEAARLDSRQAAARLMREHLEEEGVVQFLSLSLKRNSAGAWVWRFNAEGLRAGYDSLLAAPAGGTTYPGPTLFIRGERSDYVDEEGIRAVSSLFPAAEVRTIPGTGHWLHAEAPEAFNTAVLAFLREHQAPQGSGDPS